MQPPIDGVPAVDDASLPPELNEWLSGLTGCPPVTRVLGAICRQDVHADADEPFTWFYVEADATAGVARLRCLACGHAEPIRDSEDRWTFPMSWCCRSCRQAIAEVGFGVHDEDGVPTWLAVAVRCVHCGEMQGVADLVLEA